MGAHDFFRRLASVIVGAVLFCGGVLKLMDPAGSTLVMESYLNFMNLGFMRFAAGFLSMAFNLFECVLGAALVSGVLPVVAGWACGILMGFYTLLTLALLILNPSMDCGCFGEAVHLTHLQSFLKNIVLMALWAVFFFPVKRPVRPHKRRFISFGIICAAVVCFMVMSYRRLPVMDLTDLRTGTELTEGRIPLLGDDGEYHDELLMEGNVLMISVYDPSSLSEAELDRIYEERNVARAAGYRPVLVYAGEGGIYTSDRKTLLSLNRSNGGATFISNGQIAKKWPNNSLPTSLELSKCASADPSELISEDSLRGRRTIELTLLVGMVVMVI